MIVEKTVQNFFMFLQQIQSPMANEFAEYVKNASDLLSKSLFEHGHSFKYKIPVEEIVNRWKKTEIWEFRLLEITHDLTITGNALLCKSRLSVEPESKHPILDLVSTNIPTDDFFTLSHQQKLSIIASIGTGTLIEILKNEDTLIDYLNLVAAAITIIVEQLNVEGEHLSDDIEMFSGLVQLVSENLDDDNDVKRGICFGTSMYTCALSEKILRILFIHLAKDEKYIPINKATLGELLSVNNNYVVGIFGENHVKNLSFFFHRAPPSNIGHNIRNSLAHWANISPEAMNPTLVGEMLWLFTNILNTVFWFCLNESSESDEDDDQL